jgi:hypothetical protein
LQWAVAEEGGHFNTAEQPVEGEELLAVIAVCSVAEVEQKEFPVKQLTIAEWRLSEVARFAQQMHKC